MLCNETKNKQSYNHKEPCVEYFY